MSFQTPAKRPHSPSKWEDPAPRVSIRAPMIQLPYGEPSQNKPIARMTIEEVIAAEESSQQEQESETVVNMAANPFPHVEGMPRFPWHLTKDKKGPFYAFNKSWSPYEVYLCDRLYHLSPNGFTCPILAAIAPREPWNRALQGKVMRTDTIHLVMCPMTSDDFHLYFNLMQHLWHAYCCDKPFSRSDEFEQRFTRCFVDWRVFHRKRHVLQSKLMFYLDDRVSHADFIEDMLIYLIPVCWDPARDDFRQTEWAWPDDPTVPGQPVVRIVRDAVYWPIEPPPLTNQGYDRHRFIPVFWSEL